MMFSRSSSFVVALSLLSFAASTQAFSMGASQHRVYGPRTTTTSLNVVSFPDFGGSLTTIAADSSMSGLTDLVGAGNEPLLLGGAAVAVLALAAVAASSAMPKASGETAAKEAEPEPEPEPIDVSIPYDATVILAYKEWRKEEPNLKSELFAQFKALYLEKTVAEVTMKQKARNFERLTSSV